MFLGNYYKIYIKNNKKIDNKYVKYICFAIILVLLSGRIHALEENEKVFVRNINAIVGNIYSSIANKRVDYANTIGKYFSILLHNYTMFTPLNEQSDVLFAPLNEQKDNIIHTLVRIYCNKNFISKYKIMANIYNYTNDWEGVGGYLNTKNEWGQTPLHIAVQNGNFRLAKALIKAGANPILQDNKGYNIFHYIADHVLDNSCGAIYYQNENNINFLELLFLRDNVLSLEDKIILNTTPDNKGVLPIGLLFNTFKYAFNHSRSFKGFFLGYKKYIIRGLQNLVSLFFQGMDYEDAQYIYRYEIEPIEEDINKQGEKFLYKDDCREILDIFRESYKLHTYLNLSRPQGPIAAEWVKQKRNILDEKIDIVLLNKNKKRRYNNA